MKKKRILAMLLSMVMLITLMPSVVLAAEEVVQIESNGGTYKCASLTEAVAAAVSGDTLRLIANDTKKQQVTIDKSLTIELDGHSLTDTSLKVSGSGVNVLLNDSVGGAKINKNRYKGFKMENGTATLKRCTATVYVTGGAALKINGVTGTDKNTGTIIYDCATDDLEKAVLVDGSTLEVNGGTFVAVDNPGNNSLFVYNGNVTVNDGYFYTAISFFSMPTSQYPFVVKKCTIYGGIWVEELGRFLKLDEIETIILAQSPGSSATEDTKNKIITIKDASEKATTDWLNTSGNILYVGDIAVTADNAANIIEQNHTGITGTAKFEVTDSVPTLYLNGVNINEGYKKEGSSSSVYDFYGIYYKPASEGKLKIKLSGTSVIEPREYTDSTHTSARTHGIIADGDCTELSIEGGENAKLSVTSEQCALRASGYDKTCVISITGGEYEFKTDNGDDYSGEAITVYGSIKIENAKMDISSKRNRGIWINWSKEQDKEITSIKNSEINIKAGSETENTWDGITSAAKIIIENSRMDIECEGIGLETGFEQPITISGADTKISINSGKTTNTGSDKLYGSIVTRKDYNVVPEITLNDGLVITTPEAGRISVYDFRDLTDEYGDYRTIVDQNGRYAKEVVIEKAITHCVCGKAECTEHIKTMMHTSANSLNLKKDVITDGKTLSDGSYYLSDDLTVDTGKIGEGEDAVNFSKEINVSGNVNICLNGHKLEACIVPNDNAVLNICDCRGGGTITNSGGHVICYKNNNITVNIYGGTLETPYDKANTIVDFEDKTGNILNIYGGTVKHSGTGSVTAIGSRTLTVNLYGGEVAAAKADGIVVRNGKLNLCGNTKITVPTGYDSIKVYNKELIDANGYSGGNISILCEELSDRDTVVKNVSDTTAAKFTLSDKNDNCVLKRVGSDLVYAAEYTVSFDPSGGSGTMNSVTVVSGDYTLPRCTFTAPANKIFKAWDVNGTEYAPGRVVDIANDTAVKAVWASKEGVKFAEAQQSFEYDGNAKSFGITASNASGGFTVKYKKDDAEVIAPVNAGEYDVIITRAEDDTYLACSKTIPKGLIITPKDITNKALTISFGQMKYNGSEQAPSATVTIDGLSVTGSWSKVTNVNDTTTFTANGNFKGTIAGVSTGMTKKQSGVITAPSAIQKLVFNGNPQTLINGGTADGGTLKYSIDNKATWSEALPTGTDAGEYVICFMVFGDANHTDSDSNFIHASIAKAQQTAPASPDAASETVKGKADGKITGVDDTMEYKAADASEYTAVAEDTSIIENLAAGTYKVRYKETKNLYAGEDKTLEIGEGKMITLTFDSNGGSEIAPKTCEYNQKITAPDAEPTKEGYAFAGWFADSGLTNEWSFETPVTEDKTVYAKWVRGIVSDSEDDVEDIESSDLTDIARSEKTDITLAVRVREENNADESQTAIKAADKAPNNFDFYDITLKKFTGGTVEQAPDAIEIRLPYDFSRKTNVKAYRHHGGAVQELEALGARDTEAPYEDGKCFIDEDGGYVYIYSSKFSTYSIAYDTVRSSSGGGGGVKRYTVKFDANGAGSVGSQRVAKGGTVTKPSEIKKDGYTFGGWYLDPDFNEEYDFSAKVTNNITLYAKWIENIKGGEAADNSGKDNFGNTGGEDVDTHSCPSKEFDDLDVNLWYHGDTDYVLSNGLMNGVGDRVFAPNDKLTRAMLVTILYRNEGKPEISTDIPFKDVDGGAYYAGAVKWAHQNGVVKGISETAFAPEDNITREQIAAIMYRYARYKGYDTSAGENTNILSYDDFDSISKYAIGAIQYAAGSGLIKGRTESTLNPQDNATRAETAAVLHRFIENNK